MKKSFTLILAIASLLTFTAQAETTKYHTNGAFDNLFFSLGAGANGILDNGVFEVRGVGLDVAAGKWYTPSVGARIGWHGLNNRSENTVNGWFAGNQRFAQNYLHADFLWNPVSALYGYKEERLIEIVTYYHAGLLTTSFNGSRNNELGTGAGLLLQVRLNSWLDAQADLMATFSREEAWRNAGRVICFPSLSVGLSANFGRSTHTFEKHSAEKVVEMVTVVADCDHEAIITDLKGQIDSLLARPVEKDTVKMTEYINDGMVTYFVIDKYEILLMEKFHLMDLVANLPEGAALEIVGHADKETGSVKHNQWLSEKRASAIEAELRDLGFTGKVSVRAEGDNANPFPKNAPKNRCVTITVDRDSLNK